VKSRAFVSLNQLTGTSAGGVMPGAGARSGFRGGACDAEGNVDFLGDLVSVLSGLDFEIAAVDFEV
jgi:hypothetical protein